jgi:imidazolonepropionase-like amidohydrolase
MKFEGADGFIKFALGENVKQSNWGDMNTIRYPQTRMGVEQVYIDGFTRAREYQNRWTAYNKSGGKLQLPRKDLELEALSEILNKKRFITCHSYQQGEINMLMHVADSFNFRVNTFTHILEGYKVADKMKRHGVGASTFSDWWAYKFEVMEAIPYNGRILHDMGVVTAYNSDDAEMARRLNQEAAKAIKYGNVSEEEALKFVTLNPAILLHIDNRVGSIKEGKDADVVIWDNNPLSIYAKVQKTFVDGVCYYDATEEEQMVENIYKEKTRLMNKSLDEKGKGANMGKPSYKMEELNHCNNKEQLPH